MCTVCCHLAVLQPKAGPLLFQSRVSVCADDSSSFLATGVLMWVGWSAGASSWAEISMRQVPLSSDSDVAQQGQGADMTKTAAKDQKEGPAEAKPERPLETDMPKTTAEGPEEERPRPAVKLVEAGTQTLESALRGEVPEPSNGVTNEPMETWSVATEEPHPNPVDDSLNEEDSEELLALRRLRESVRKCVEGMHSHIATQIKEAAVKAMPRPAAKAVASKALPKSGRKRGSVDKDLSSVDKEPKDLRRRHPRRGWPWCPEIRGCTGFRHHRECRATRSPQRFQRRRGPKGFRDRHRHRMRGSRLRLSRFM